MGNYSEFEIHTDPPACNVLINKGYCVTTDGGGFYEYEDTMKWYDWKKDIMAVSKLHPATVWTVQRNGEQTGDMERAYFKNGKHYSEKLEYVPPAFDESKLK